MSLDTYDAGASLDSYYPSRTERRPARIYTTDKLAADLAEAGLFGMFSGPGTNPTGLAGYATTKLWLNLPTDPDTGPGTWRVYDGSGDATLVTSWPAFSATGFRYLLGVTALLAGITSDDVGNNSGVTGTTISDALDALSAAVDAIVSGGGSGDLLSTNNLSDVASASTARDNLGLAIGTDVQAYSSNLDSWAAVNESAYYNSTEADAAISAAVAALSAGAPDLYKTGSFSELVTSSPMNTSSTTDTIYYRLGPFVWSEGDIVVALGNIEFTNENDYEAVGVVQFVLATSATALSGYEFNEMTGGNVRQTTTHHMPLTSVGTIRVPADGTYWVNMVGGTASSAASGGHVMLVEQDEGGISLLHWNAPTITYAADAVTFDGVNDYLTRGANLSTVVDGKKFLFSGWVKFDSSKDSQSQYICATSNTAERFGISKSASNNKIYIEGRNSAGTLIMQMVSATAYTSADGWIHIMAAADLSLGTAYLYVDGVSDLAASPTLTNDTIDFTQGAFAIGARTDGTSKLAADVADLYIHLTPFALYDLSSSTLRAFFRDESGKPAYHHENARSDTGNSVTTGPPTVFLSGDATLFHHNRGKGGGFTVNGTLTDASTSPSD